MSAVNPTRIEPVFTDPAGLLYIHATDFIEAAGFTLIPSDIQNELISFSANGYNVEISLTMGDTGEAPSVEVYSNGVLLEPNTYHWIYDDGILYLSSGFIENAAGGTVVWSPELLQLFIYLS